MPSTPSDASPLENKDLVVFENIGDTYPIDEDLIVDFFLNPGVKGSTKDWLGIYEQGWKGLENPLAFEWGLGRPRENCGRKRRIIFRSKYLEKAEFNTNYQFVYIDKYLVILGESSFFQFRADNENSDKESIKLSCEESSRPSSRETNSSTKRNMQSVSNKKMPVRCQFNFQSAGKVYTTCSDCIEFFNSSQIKDELRTKLKEYTSSNEGLHKRLSRLEYLLEVPLTPSVENWDRQIEEHQFESFVAEVFGTHRETGNTPLKHLQVQSKEIDNLNFSIGAVTKKELFLKAIIGHQDMRIQQLTCLLLQKKAGPTKPNCTAAKWDIVKTYRTDEKMVAEIYDLNNNSSDNTSHEEDCEDILNVDSL